MINDGYDMIKSFEREHTGDRQEIITEEKKIIAEITKVANRVITEYREYRNKEIDELELIARIKPLLPQIEELFLRESNLNIPPVDIHDWMLACTSLINTVYDFVFFYKDMYLEKRTVENRRQCMDMTIKRYHENLNKLHEESRKIGL